MGLDGFEGFWGGFGEGRGLGGFDKGNPRSRSGGWGLDGVFVVVIMGGAAAAGRGGGQAGIGVDSSQTELGSGGVGAEGEKIYCRQSDGLAAGGAVVADVAIAGAGIQNGGDAGAGVDAVFLLAQRAVGIADDQLAGRRDDVVDVGDNVEVVAAGVQADGAHRDELDSAGLGLSQLAHRLGVVLAPVFDDLGFEDLGRVAAMGGFTELFELLGGVGEFQHQYVDRTDFLHDSNLLMYLFNWN